MKTTEEEDETTMDEFVSVPDCREPESAASTTVDEEDCAIYIDSDIDKNEAHQQGFDLVDSQVDIPQNGESSAEEDACDLLIIIDK